MLHPVYEQPVYRPIIPEPEPEDYANLPDDDRQLFLPGIGQWLDIQNLKRLVNTQEG